MDPKIIHLCNKLNVFFLFDVGLQVMSSLKNDNLAWKFHMEDLVHQFWLSFHVCSDFIFLNCSTKTSLNESMFENFNSKEFATTLLLWKTNFLSGENLLRIDLPQTKTLLTRLINQATGVIGASWVRSTYNFKVWIILSRKYFWWFSPSVHLKRQRTEGRWWKWSPNSSAGSVTLPKT